MKRQTIIVVVISLSLLVSLPVLSGETAWQAPTRNIPVPDHVSEALQKVIRNTKSPASIPAKLELTEKELRVMIKQHTENLLSKNPELIKLREVKIKQESIAGVNGYWVMPKTVKAENKDKLFVFIHGGAYIFGPGEAGLDEPMLLAERLGIKVYSIDYRMPPDHPYPAAVDDVIAVYKKLIESYHPKIIAMGGSSSGGGLLLSSVQQFQTMELPMPAALFVGTPWADLSNIGDSYAINHGVDQVLLSYSMLEPAAKAYANGMRLTDKRISPIYGEFKNFPPTMIVSGTRDLFLSNAVRVHRKLRSENVDADLHIYEGMSHATYLKAPQVPEVEDMYKELQRFLNQTINKR